MLSNIAQVTLRFENLSKLISTPAITKFYRDIQAHAGNLNYIFLRILIIFSLKQLQQLKNTRHAIYKFDQLYQARHMAVCRRSFFTNTKY